MSSVELCPAQLIRETGTFSEQDVSEQDDGVGARSTRGGQPSASQLPYLGQCTGLVDRYRYRLPALFVRAADDGGFQVGVTHNFFHTSRRCETAAAFKGSSRSGWFWKWNRATGDRNCGVTRATAGAGPRQCYEVAISQGLRKAALLCGLFALCACTAANGPGVVPVALRSPPSPNVVHRTDQVQVKVYNEPEISGDYLVDGAGYVSIPLAGRIRAAGLTVPALEREITSRLNRGLIKDPKVNVQISVYAPFFIHGEVKQSGQFPYRPGMTVLDAVASASGFTYRADERTAYVRSAGAKHERAYPLTSPVPIRPGDNIRIGERLF